MYTVHWSSKYNKSSRNFTFAVFVLCRMHYASQNKKNIKSWFFFAEYVKAILFSVLYLIQVLDEHADFDLISFFLALAILHYSNRSFTIKWSFLPLLKSVQMVNELHFFVKFILPAGGKIKKMTHRQNDLPPHPLVLCSTLLNDHGHFN